MNTGISNIIATHQHKQGIVTSTIVKWRALAVNDVKNAINRTTIIGGGKDDDNIQVGKCSGIIGLARTLLIMDKLESPAHNSAINSSGYLDKILNDILEASKVKDNGERTFKAKLLSNVNPMDLHINDIFTVIEGLAIIKENDIQNELLSMLYNRVNINNIDRLSDNEDRLSDRCLDLISSISRLSMQNNNNKEGRVIAINAAEIIFNNNNADINMLWMLRKACGKLGLVDIVNNIDKIFYSRINYIGRLGNIDNDNASSSLMMITNTEAMVKSSIGSLIEWSLQRPEGFTIIPSNIKNIIMDTNIEIINNNDIARIINSCLRCKNDNDIDIASQLLRGCIDRIIKRQNGGYDGLTRDDLHNIMVGVLKRIKNNNKNNNIIDDYVNDIVAILNDKIILKLRVFKPYQLVDIIKVLLLNITRYNSNKNNDNGDNNRRSIIVNNIIDILNTRGHELSLDGITSIISHTYTQDGYDRLTANERDSIKAILNNIFKISEDINERIQEIELIKIALDGTRRNNIEPGRIALHLLCILGDHGLVDNNNKEVLPIVNVLKEYIKENTPINVTSYDISRACEYTGILDNAFDVLEALDDFINKPNNIFLITTDECVKLLCSAIKVIGRHNNDDINKEFHSGVGKLGSILFDQYSLYGTRTDITPNHLMSIIEATLDNINELTTSTNTFNNALLLESIRVLIPIIHTAEADRLIKFIALLSHKKSLLPKLNDVNRYSPLSQLSLSILKTLSEYDNLNINNISNALKAMARLDWYDNKCISNLINCIMNNKLSVNNMDYITDLVILYVSHATTTIQSLRVLRVYDALLLSRLIKWYKWVLEESYGRPPYPPHLKAHLASFALPIVELGYKSNIFIDLIEYGLIEDYSNNKTTDPKLLISFLYMLSRQDETALNRPSFMNGVKRLVTTTTPDQLQSLGASDWIKTFEIHLAAAIEAPSYIKREMINNNDIKKFIEDNASFTWYSLQEKNRTQFLHTNIYKTLKETIEDELSWPLYTANQLGEVYYTEFVTEPSPSRSGFQKGLSADNRRTAVVCIKDVDELRYHRSIDGNISMINDKGGINVENGYNKSTRIMIGTSLIKIRHLTSLGWKIIPIWLSEWAQLMECKDRVNYLIQQSTRAYALGPDNNNNEEKEEEDKYYY